MDRPAGFVNRPVSRNPQGVVSRLAESNGMRLPNSDIARVERGKVVDYLLNLDHKDGGSKAEFFRRFGFSPEDWKEMADALLEHGKTHEVSRMVESNHGLRYQVDGELNTPDGRRPRIRTVWIFDADPPSESPRLITAYPN